MEVLFNCRMGRMKNCFPRSTLSGFVAVHQQTVKSAVDAGAGSGWPAALLAVARANFVDTQRRVWKPMTDSRYNKIPSSSVWEYGASEAGGSRGALGGEPVAGLGW